MDYDNTDRGSFFKPRADESLLVQGKLNSEGSEYRIAIVKASLPDGGTARDVYVKVGTIACWKTVSKDGNTKFLSARIGDSTPRVEEPAKDQTIIENESVLGDIDDPDEAPW